MLDNGVYATTGGQPVPGAKTVDYVGVARASGYPRAHSFAEIGDFGRELPGIMAAAGPVFVALKVLPEVENTAIGARPKWNPRTRDRVIADLRGELGVA